MASSRTTADMATIALKNRAMEAMSCPRLGRRPRSIIGASTAVFIMAMLQFLGRPAMGAFEYGEPIEVLVSAGDDLTLTFEGDTVDAVAVSFQQCSGSEYMSMEIDYDDYILRDGTLSSNTCHRIVGAGTSFDDSALDYDNLCAFQSSGTVGRGYDEESTTLSGGFTDSNSTTANDTSNSTSISYLSVDPGLVYVKLTNEGTIAASAELVMFSTTVSSTNAGAAIDRVHTENEQDDNTFTVTADFQASGTDQSFCAADEGCAVYAYYINMDEMEDATFETSCQAREGIKVYEGYTSGEELDDTTATAVVQSTTAFEIEACVELPKETEGTYRVYVIVSPDTSTYARVGYGLQDQLIYASSDITVDDSMDKSCPEEIEVESTSGATRVNITPIQASGMMAMTLAAAATRAGF